MADRRLAEVERRPQGTGQKEGRARDHPGIPDDVAGTARASRQRFENPVHFGAVLPNGFQQRFAGFAKACRAVTLDFLLPIAAAWMLVTLVHRHHYGSHWHLDAPGAGTYGPIRLKLKLPGTAERIPEPIIVCGYPGKASLVYIRLLRNARAKVGVEFWGLGAYESDEFALPAANATIALNCSLPALYPAEGSGRWEATPAARQALLRHEYSLAVDGVVRLKGSVDYDQPDDSPIYFGLNPVGGSLVSERFTGRILNPPDSNR
jgi:hypothetical protein